MQKLEQLLEWGGTKRDIVFLILSGLALLLSIFHLNPFPFDMAWVAIILCGVPIILEAVIGLVTAFDIKADVLVSIALIASVLIGEDFAAGEVAFIMQLGGLLEDLTVARARAGIEKLVHLTPHTARRIQAGQEQILPAEQVQAGDILRVLPGETVPVDGVILSGQTSINQAVMTGESLPVDKGVGDMVSSGTVNQFGSFDMKATRVGEDSSIQRMIRLVQSADAGKAKIVGIADRWATWIVVIALTAAALTWLISGQIIRAVTILVVFCPCALVLATPTAIMVGTGKGAEHGVLIKGGEALEALRKVDTVVLDKTGTITQGKPEIVECTISEAVKRYAAIAEKNSEHPIGKAVYSFLDDGNTPAPDEFQSITGGGVFAKYDGHEIYIGNLRLMREHGIDAPEADGLYVALDGNYEGNIKIADTVKPTSKEAIAKLSGMQVYMITGDSEKPAKEIAELVGISNVFASVLPGGKAEIVEQLQKEGRIVAFVGDGINDAVALTSADVGIAMGTGTDIAGESADIVLMRGDLNLLPFAVNLSKATVRKIKQNLFWAFVYNSIGVPFAAFGFLNPIIAGAAMALSSVSVITNSLFIHVKEKI